MDIQTKDGILLRGIPDGTPDDVIKQRIAQIRQSKQPAQPDPSVQLASEQSIPQALTIATGRGLDTLAMGLKQGVLGGGAVLSELLPSGLKAHAQDYITKELIDTQKQQQGFDRAYAPLKAAHPIATTVGEALPMMAAPMLRPLSGAGAIPAVVNAGVSAAAPALIQYGSAEDKAKNAAIAAATGGLLTAGMRGLSKVVSPDVSPEVQMLMREGVTPTPGQIMGGKLSKFEEKLTSAPILGDAISAARARTNEDFNKAVINRGLSKIGEKVDAIGREGVSQAADKISQKYEALLPFLKVKIDKPFADEMTGLAQMAQNLPTQQAEQFKRIVGDNLANRFSPSGGMAGKTLKEAESKLGYYIRQYGFSTNPDQRMLADALKETQASLRNLVMRSNPEKAQTLRDINAAFAQQVRVEGAAGRLGSRDGVFTPEGFAGAVKAADRSSRKNAFAKGDSLMQDLADAGLNVLGRTVPDSGTAGRLANIAAVGTAAINPAPLMAAGGASLLYSPQGQKLLADLLTKRPQFAELLGQNINQIAPQLGMAGGLLAAAEQ
jgi:hypothetical protein